MEYQGKEIKKLGFGFMRLPMLGEEIDLEQTKQMVDLFMEKGFRYFDTAYGYLNQRSEGALKTTVIDRYPREELIIATKLPAWNKVATAKEAEQMFYTSLERTGAGYFDFYLLHNLGGPRTRVFDDFDLWNFTLARKKEGLIRNLGFSIHDNAAALEKVLEKHHQYVDFIQLQINYSDWEHDSIQSRLCHEVAMKYNKPVVIMEPVRGGHLANPPQSVKDALDGGEHDWSYSKWALKFAGSQKNIITVLSGMSNLAQMEENLQTMDNFQPLNQAEYAVIAKAQQAIAAIKSIPCTNCRYCVEGCPKNIAIPDVLGAMNKVLVYNDVSGAKGTYSFFTNSTGAKASDCVKCGLCERDCPQSIEIIRELEEIATVLEA